MSIWHKNRWKRVLSSFLFLFFCATLWQNLNNTSNLGHYQGSKPHPLGTQGMGVTFGPRPFSWVLSILMWCSLVSRAWEIAGTKYEDPKLAKKSAFSLLSDGDDAKSLEIWNCRTSAGNSSRFLQVLASKNFKLIIGTFTSEFILDFRVCFYNYAI